MSVELNKATIRRMVEKLFNRGNINRVGEFWATDFIEHEVLPPGIPAGPEGTKQMIGMMHTAFPDFKATINELIAEGDLVAIRMTWTGTHKGEFMGMPATGKGFSIGIFDIIRMADGKCTEHWGLMDTAAMMQQLGAVPAPGMAH